MADVPSAKKTAGTLALIGGGEWEEPCRPLDTRLLAAAGTRTVLVLPTAAAFEHADRHVQRAREWFGGLGADVEVLDVLNRRDAEQPAPVKAMEKARFVYVADGSPLHLRSVLKGSALYDALRDAHLAGAVVAASGAGATLLCDPMVDPRGGAYTVGLGLVTGMAVFPYHGTAADHMRERSIELLPKEAVLVGLDEHTAIVRGPGGEWTVTGPGAATVYRRDAEPQVARDGDQLSVMTTVSR
jgi:cyanophycinase